MDIYVGNLPYTATEGDVSGLFAAFGPVERVKIITDRETGQSKGFAFVTMSEQSEADKAVSMFNAYSLGDHALKVSPANPREERVEKSAAIKP